MNELQENELMTEQLLTSSKEMATRLNISVTDAISHKVAIWIKHSKNDTEAAAWDIRGENAKILLEKTAE